MKKITAVLLVALIFIMCVCLSGCSFIFGLLGGLLNGDGTNPELPSDHAHQFDSYFTYTHCNVTDCPAIGRKVSDGDFRQEFAYTLTNTKIAQIEGAYNQILTYLNDCDDYSQFEEAYKQYVEYYDYVIFQYQVASVLSDVDSSIVNANRYKTASKLYNETYANYYALYELIYNSNLRDEFYQGWTDDEINDALYYAEIYGGAADNNNAVDEILTEYNDYLNQIGEIKNRSQLNKIGEIYGKLVQANNNIATVAHYDNYMDYAYAHEYNRDYAPDDVADYMRDYVKQYIAPAFIKVAEKYDSLSSDYFKVIADSNFYFALMFDSMFTGYSDINISRARQAVNYVGDYLNYINRPSSYTNGASVDFGAAVEDLFKNGNYFTGDYQGAYTWWVRSIDKPIVYFGEEYDTAFTFVHEFGHYYENVYNGDLTLSYDHDETHSQGNEMLFLAWLAQNKSSGVTNGYDMVEIEQLFDMLGNIIIATAVDEFEQAAYTGVYEGAPITVSYAELFDKILRSYNYTYNGKTLSAADYLNSSYWAYVVFDSAAYYVSYAMSALPSIELYVKAKTDGLYEARDSYIKLFTFANDSRFVTTDAHGNKVLTEEATYQAILNYCGLQGPFEKGLYTDLLNYFNSRTDL